MIVTTARISADPICEILRCGDRWLLTHVLLDLVELIFMFEQFWKLGVLSTEFYHGSTSISTAVKPRDCSVDKFYPIALRKRSNNIHQLDTGPKLKSRKLTPIRGNMYLYPVSHNITTQLISIVLHRGGVIVFMG